MSLKYFRKNCIEIQLLGWKYSFLQYIPVIASETSLYSSERFINHKSADQNNSDDIIAFGIYATSLAIFKKHFFSEVNHWRQKIFNSGEKKNCSYQLVKLVYRYSVYHFLISSVINKNDFSLITIYLLYGPDKYLFITLFNIYGDKDKNKCT